MDSPDITSLAAVFTLRDLSTNERPAIGLRCFIYTESNSFKLRSWQLLWEDVYKKITFKKKYYDLTNPIVSAFNSCTLVWGCPCCPAPGIKNPNCSCLVLIDRPTSKGCECKCFYIYCTKCAINGIYQTAMCTYCTQVAKQYVPMSCVVPTHSHSCLFLARTR